MEQERRGNLTEIIKNIYWFKLNYISPAIERIFTTY